MVFGNLGTQGNKKVIPNLFHNASSHLTVKNLITPLDFSIGFQNVEGLHSDCECFLSDMTENMIHDIHFLCETWSCDHDKKVTGYENFFQNGYKTPGVTSGRSSGGLLVFIKERIHKFVKILQLTPYTCWLEIDKCLFNDLDKNIILSAQYSPPCNSKYHSQNSNENLRSDLLSFCDENTPIILIGDFNARTGDIPDNLVIDANFDPSVLEQTEFKKRNNLDQILNTQGKNFVDTLISNNLRILNGRFTGDLLGNFTTHKNGHASVNDYGVVSDNFFDRISNFTVFPQNVFSDHSKIVVSIKNTSKPPISTCTDKNWYSLPKRIKWSPKSLDELSKLLNNVPDEKIDSITRKLNQSDIYEATSMLIELIENSCKSIEDFQPPQVTTKKVPFPHKRKKRKNKTWFDHELQILKNNTKKLAIQKHQCPENLELRELHRKSLKEYKKQCNTKRTAFREDTFAKMNDSLHDGEKMWDEFRKFSETRSPKSGIDEKISAMEWKTHFENLHTENREQAVPMMVENRPSKSLNKKFKMKELLAVIKKNEK